MNKQKHHSPNWGGHRQNAGQKPKWNSGETKPLRLPITLRNELLHYAHLLDEGTYPSCKLDPVTHQDDNHLTSIKSLIKTYKTQIHPTSPRWQKTKELITAIEAILNS